MEFLDSLKQVNTNWQPYKKWEAEQEDKEFQHQELHKRVPTSKEDLEKVSQYGRTLIDSINVMDQYSINKAEDVELFTNLGIEAVNITLGIVGGTIGFIAQFNKKINGVMLKNKYLKPLTPHIATIGALALPLITLPYFLVKAKHYEKEASRVARHEARETELKDPKHFVIYSKEQVEKAKLIAKDMPDLPDKVKKSLNPITNYHDSFKSIKEILKDHDDYRQKRDENIANFQQKLAQIQNNKYSQEQLKNAKNDQENLQRIIRKIETSSQNYLNNTEFAMDVTLCSGALGGYISGKLLALTMKGLQKLNILSSKSNSIKTAQKIMPGISTLLVAAVTSVYAIKLQKEAAKVGRYKAKQELLNDPRNFINYSDEQQNSVKDLKVKESKESIFNKFLNNFKTAIKVSKDYKEYKNYEKTARKEEEKLDKALMGIVVSPEQFKDAESLQKNAFLAFEKIDEKAQRYTDDLEAATDIGRTFFDFAVSAVPAIMLGVNMNKEAVRLAAEQDIKKVFINMISAGFKKSWIAFAISGALQIGYDILANELKKKAGRIGVMEAIQELQEPRLFVNNIDT